MRRRPGSRQAGRPLRLLALTIAIGGVLSAFLVNDIVVFAMTPLLCAGLAARKLDARPFLFGLAAASNAGSAATLIGNPQNIMIGQVGGLGFWSYFAAAIVPSVIGLVISFACIAWIWRGSLQAEAAAAPIAAPQFDRRATGICGLALLVLLVLFTTPLPREISALLIAACLIVSRKFVTRQLLDEIDLPLLILFAGLFVVNDAFARTGLAEQAMPASRAPGCCPIASRCCRRSRWCLSNTIGNVPAVVMILKVWHGIPEGTMVGLAILSTLAGNLFLVGSLANLIVAERAAGQGVLLTSAITPRPACRSPCCRCWQPAFGYGAPGSWTGDAAAIARSASSQPAAITAQLAATTANMAPSEVFFAMKPRIGGLARKPA